MKVLYPARILADESFIEWLIKKDKIAFLKLTHIKSSSIDCKGNHNIMIEEDIQNIIQKKIITESNLRASFKGKEFIINIPRSINKKDKIIILAIYLATNKPFKTYIFTTKDMEREYTGSPHYQNVKSISVKSEEDALTIINSFWNLFKTERDLNH